MEWLQWDIKPFREALEDVETYLGQEINFPLTENSIQYDPQRIGYRLEKCLQNWGYT